MADNRRCEPKKFGGMSSAEWMCTNRIEKLIILQDLVQEQDTKSHIVRLAVASGVVVTSICISLLRAESSKSSTSMSNVECPCSIDSIEDFVSLGLLS